MFDDEGDDEPVKGKKAKVKETALREETIRVTTVGDLKKLLAKLPDYAKVQHAYDDDIYDGLEVNYSTGSSWSEPYFCAN